MSDTYADIDRSTSPTTFGDYYKLAAMVADEMARIVAERPHHGGQPIAYEELLTVARDVVFSREVVPANLHRTSFDYYVTNLYTYRVVSRRQLVLSELEEKW